MYNAPEWYNGNIDMISRPLVKNDDGTISTIRSISFNPGTGEIIIPTVSDDGRILSDDEAIQQYFRTGNYLGMANTVEEAEKYAQMLHEYEEQRIKGVKNEGVNQEHA